MRVTLEAYLENRRRAAHDVRGFRAFCAKCRHAKVVCDCANIRPFEAPVEIAILIHPAEARRRIATGRLTHSLITNSHLLEGENFEQHPRVQSFLADPARECFILYPSAKVLNLSQPDERAKLTDCARKPLIFVIDGTWRTAKKMLRLSPSLANLPHVSFNSPGLSRFRIRKQPAEVCLSTLEAVYSMIDLLKPSAVAPNAPIFYERPHDHMLEIFDRMVERQIDYQKRLGSSTLNRKCAKQTCVRSLPEAKNT